MDVDGDNLKRKLSMEDDECPQSNEEANISTDEHTGVDDEHLRQFDVLDEVQGDESGSENGDNEQKGKTQISFSSYSIELTEFLRNPEFNWLVHPYRDRFK